MKTISARRRILLGMGILMACGRTLAAFKEWRIEIPDVEPWVMHADSGRPGLLVDYLEQLARRSALPLHTAPIVYARMAHDLQGGMTDLAVGLDSPDLRAGTETVAPLFSVPAVMVGRADRPPLRPEDICALKIGMVRGATYKLDAAIPQCLDVHRVKDVLQGVHMVAVGRLDYVAGTDHALEAAIAQSGYPRTLFGAQAPIGKAEFMLYARKGMPSPVLRRLTQAAGEMEREHIFEYLRARYRR